MVIKSNNIRVLGLVFIVFQLTFRNPFVHILKVLKGVLLQAFQQCIQFGWSELQSAHSPEDFAVFHFGFFFIESLQLFLQSLKTGFCFGFFISNLD